jgi:UDP-N-acetylglucosamine--N-acetylmuramyl-(pentapeptide) pyrophosphoryl-undecaprenol N-acetylglucosamine transferase
MQFIHQTGSTDETDWKQLYTSKNITAHVFSYNPELALLYTAADIIICRAGAGTLFEINFFNKKCIIIPLKTATTDHQVHNAIAMSADYPDLFEYILQDDIEKNPTLLFSRLNTLLSDQIDHVCLKGLQSTSNECASQKDEQDFIDL